VAEAMLKVLGVAPAPTLAPSAAEKK